MSLINPYSSAQDKISGVPTPVSTDSFIASHLAQASLEEAARKLVKRDMANKTETESYAKLSGKWVIDDGHKSEEHWQLGASALTKQTKAHEARSLAFHCSAIKV